jgi:hypothetical protein
MQMRCFLHLIPPLGLAHDTFATPDPVQQISLKALLPSLPLHALQLSFFPFQVKKSRVGG